MVTTLTRTESKCEGVYLILPGLPFLFCTMSLSAWPFFSESPFRSLCCLHWILNLFLAHLDRTLYNDLLQIFALIPYQMIIAQSYFLAYPYMLAVETALICNAIVNQSMLFNEENVFIM